MSCKPRYKKKKKKKEWKKGKKEENVLFIDARNIFLFTVCVSAQIIPPV